MTKLEKIESDLLSLSRAEQKKFAEWYDNWRAQQFDDQIEHDAKSGKLNDIAAKALAEHMSGETTEF